MADERIEMVVPAGQSLTWFKLFKDLDNDGRPSNQAYVELMPSPHAASQ